MNENQWEDAIRAWLVGRSETTIQELAAGALAVSSGPTDRDIQRRLGKILRRLGWSRSMVGYGGSQARGWRAPEYPMRYTNHDPMTAP